MNSYYDEIKEEAKNFIEEYEDELKEIIRKNKDEDKDNDYIFDEAIYQEWDLMSKVHEWLDGIWYDFLRRDFCNDCDTELSSAAKILDESEEEETDGGLWGGQQPEDAIITKAFFTARNDLYHEIERQLKDLIREQK